MSASQCPSKYIHNKLNTSKVSLHYMKYYLKEYSVLVRYTIKHSRLTRKHVLLYFSDIIFMYCIVVFLNLLIRYARFEERKRKLLCKMYFTVLSPPLRWAYLFPPKDFQYRCQIGKCHNGRYDVSCSEQTDSTTLSSSQEGF